ncbi:MAG: ATP synthase F1 subunit epsilon [Proteobacteria bacterium]|nr:ATP synthase F1 subunit epsilon [Pseudomonadota bacterium]
MGSTTEVSLEILSPEKILFRGAAKSVMMPGKLGYMTILPGHTDLIAELDVGILEFLPVDSNQSQKYFVAGGFGEVKGGVVRVLVDVVEKISDINKDRAKSAEKRALERLEGKSNDEIDYARALVALKRAQTRLSLI